MITHVAFDFDGTLVDSLGVAIGIYNELAARSGYGQMTAANLGELRGVSILERCQRMGVPLYRLPWIMVQVTRRYRQAVRSIRFNEGIPELLQELRGRGLKVVILSTNSEENIRAFLQQQEAEAWVEAIYGGGGFFGKARRLRELLKRTGLQREQLVYVGDENRDVEACKEVGVRVIAVRWGADAEPMLRQAGPDAIVDRPADISECLGRWSAASSVAR
jgi:phosphoglycolate phosphatase